MAALSLPWVLYPLLLFGSYLTCSKHPQLNKLILTRQLVFHVLRAGTLGFDLSCRCTVDQVMSFIPMPAGCCGTVIFYAGSQAYDRFVFRSRFRSTDLEIQYFWFLPGWFWGMGLKSREGRMVGRKTHKERTEKWWCYGFLHDCFIQFHSSPLCVLIMSIFTDEEPQVQRSEVTCPRSHHSWMQSWDANSVVRHSVLWQCLDIWT